MEKENRKALEDDKTSTEVAKSKSKLVAYLLWFFLGWAGIHHFYLRRYRQGVLWLTSFGGLFGIGYLGDIFRLQKYVHYSNKRYLFVERLRQNKKYSKSGPRVSDNFHRIVSQVMFGVFYRGLIYCAIPWESPVMNYAAFILPLGTAFGTYMVSNVGLQESSFWWSLLGAYIGEFFGAYIGVYFSGLLPLSKPLSVALFSMLCSTYGWKWREKEEDASCGKLLFVALFSFIVCLILSGSFIYCNASIKANDGGVIKFHDVFDKFFNSGNITELYKTGGRIAIWERLITLQILMENIVLSKYWDLILKQTLKM
ncbi:DnaJ homolog subfamily C member 22 [Geodia barretti]|uniref:DnaJ homolog subfamily C member 22 n=1 Tax=Geodia barretti TaxID=519541 RepID=A0AA35TAK9_GEOBA|nr:DnaJ homolog subfamily C member 22 [Geodia barretti]